MIKLLTELLTELGYYQVEDNCVYVKDYDCNAQIVMRFTGWDFKKLDIIGSYVFLDNIGITDFEFLDDLKQVLQDFHDHKKIIMEFLNANA